MKSFNINSRNQTLKFLNLFFYLQIIFKIKLKYFFYKLKNIINKKK